MFWEHDCNTVPTQRFPTQSCFLPTPTTDVSNSTCVTCLDMFLLKNPPIMDLMGPNGLGGNRGIGTC